MSYKPILCLDFDGVIHSYTTGWQGADVIPDPPVPGALEFIKSANDKFSVHIFSSRSLQPGGIIAMRNWLDYWQDHDFPEWPVRISKLVMFDLEKPPAHITLDDRAITFTGAWPEIHDLLIFKPWNRR
jgi:hypothetical protein